MDLLKGFPLSIEQKERLLELIGNNNGGSEKPKLKIYFYPKDGNDIVKIDDIEYIVDSGYLVTINSKELHNKYNNYTIHDIICIFSQSLEEFNNNNVEVLPMSIERYENIFTVFTLSPFDNTIQFTVDFTY